MAGERKIIWIDGMSDENFKKCSFCSAQSTDHPVTSSPYCRIAQMHEELRKRPRLGQIAEMEIDISLVPKDCPNGY